MNGGSVPADLKRTSVLRRVPHCDAVRLRSECGEEGDICAFESPNDALAITVEAPGGRAMTIAPGDTFLATPGHRESTRWVCGRVPAGGLLPGEYYGILAECGVVGEVFGDLPVAQGYLPRVRYLGTVWAQSGQRLNIRQFAVAASAKSDHSTPVYLLLGTSGDCGKTTAGLAMVRTLRMQGHTTVIALKATGTGSVAEISRYLDFGAAQAFDCIDFGLPTTYPSGRMGIGEIFANALDFCFSQPADAVVVECGGDLFGANVPEFLCCLKARRSDPKVILAASDTLGALGAQQALAEIGLTISLITGRCTDTPAMRDRTQTLCGIPAINLLSGREQSRHASSL